MYKYTVEGLAEREAAEASVSYSGAGQEPSSPRAHWYNLKGIVVHSGTAFAGHYYSYIKVLLSSTNKVPFSLSKMLTPECVMPRRSPFAGSDTCSLRGSFSPSGASNERVVRCIFKGAGFLQDLLDLIELLASPRLLCKDEGLCWRRIEKENLARGSRGSGIALMTHRWNRGISQTWNRIVLAENTPSMCCRIMYVFLCLPCKGKEQFLHVCKFGRVVVMVAFLRGVCAVCVVFSDANGLCLNILRHCTLGTGHWQVLLTTDCSVAADEILRVTGDC